MARKDGRADRKRKRERRPVGSGPPDTGTRPPAAPDVAQPAYQEGSVDVVHADVGLGEEENDRRGQGQMPADARARERAQEPRDSFISSEVDERTRGRRERTRS